MNAFSKFATAALVGGATVLATASGAFAQRAGDPGFPGGTPSDPGSTAPSCGQNGCGGHHGGTTVNNTSDTTNKYCGSVAVAPGLAGAASGCVVVESISGAFGYIVSIGGGVSKGRMLVDCKNRAEAENFAVNSPDCRVRELGVNGLIGENPLLARAKDELYGQHSGPMTFCQITRVVKGTPRPLKPRH